MRNADGDLFAVRIFAISVDLRLLEKPLAQQCQIHAINGGILTDICRGQLPLGEIFLTNQIFLQQNIVCKIAFAVAVDVKINPIQCNKCDAECFGVTLCGGITVTVDDAIKVSAVFLRFNAVGRSWGCRW